MRPSNVQTSVVLQQTLACLKDMGVSCLYQIVYLVVVLTIDFIVGNMA